MDESSMTHQIRIKADNYFSELISLERDCQFKSSATNIHIYAITNTAD